MSVEKRFWEKVEVGEPDECWEWRASCYGSGYGQAWDGEKQVGAHRLAFRLERGGIGDSQVLHTCDNKLCVNPDHLYLGDPIDNMHDAIERGQWSSYDMSGEKNPNRRLDESEVKEIKSRYQEESISQRELGEEYGVSQEHIGRIVRGERW